DELTLRPHGQRSLLPTRDHQTVGQLVAELRRQEQPALVVELGEVSSEEHAPPPRCGLSDSGECFHHFSSTALPLTPLSTTVNQLPPRYAPVPPEFTLSASVSLPAQRSSSTESCPVPWSVADGSGGAKWRTVWSDVEDPVEESGGEEWRTGVNCSRPGTVNQTAVRS